MRLVPLRKQRAESMSAAAAAAAAATHIAVSCHQLEATRWNPIAWWADAVAQPMQAHLQVGALRLQTRNGRVGLRRRHNGLLRLLLQLALAQVESGKACKSEAAGTTAAASAATAAARGPQHTQQLALTCKDEQAEQPRA